MLTRVLADAQRKLAAAGIAGKIMEHCGTAMVVADPTLPDCPIVAVNRAFETLTGYPREEALGNNCRFLQGADTDPATVDRIRAAIAEERACEFEILNYRRDGTAFWCLLHLSPVYDETGALTLFVSSQRDETERVQSVEMLRRGHERLQSALSASRAVGTFEWDVEADHLTVDGHFARVFDLSPAAAEIGLPISAYLDQIDEADRERVTKAVDEAWRTGDLYEEEYAVVGSDGIRRHVLGHGRRTARGNGAACFAGVVIDITKRRAAEIALAEALSKQSFLIREINHRIKNLFALVPAILGLAARTAASTDELVASVRARINALAASHALAFEMSSDGNGTDLRTLAETIIEPYDAAKISAGCSPVRVDQEASNAFALTLHELATNAAKYGSLAGDGGVLTIDWAIEPSGDLRFEWVEIAAQEIDEPTSRPGFGTQLVDRLFSALGGRIERKWHREGLSVDLIVPARHIRTAA